MKRTPSSRRDPQIVHLAVNTGDKQAIDITQEGFDPGVIKLMHKMETKPWAGYRLLVQRWPHEACAQPNIIRFYVIRHSDDMRLTHNLVNLKDWPPVLHLETIVLAVMSPTEAGTLADLEQCAAIALAGIDVEAIS